MTDTALPPAPSFDPYEPPSAPPAPERRSPWFYVLLSCGGLFLLFLLVIGSCVGFLASRGSDLTPACESYMAKVQAGNFVGAYEEASQQFKRGGWDQATFVRFEKRMQGLLGRLESKSRSGVQVFTNEARLQYDAKYSNGPVQVTYVLVKEEGRWRIAGVNYKSPLVDQGFACPSCGGRNRLDATFCAHCGKPLPDTP